MVVTTCELKWLKYLLSSLGILHPKPMRLYSDSQSAIHISKNSVFYDRTKHIEVDCHFIRDKLTFGHLSTSYVPTGHQALGQYQFGFLLRKLGIWDIHAPSLGGVLEYYVY